MRYREWADSARLCVPEGMTQEPTFVSCEAYLPLPESWSMKKKASLSGQLHRQKPDADNILKAVCDALFKDDSVIARISCLKLWNDGQGARIELTITL